MKDQLGHGSNAHNAGIEQVPPKGANELHMFGENDGNLYRQSKQPIEANLDKKIGKGVYDHGLATKLWGYHADRAAQSYNKQMPDRPGQKWHDQFPPAVRQAAAKMWANDFKADRNPPPPHNGSMKMAGSNVKQARANANKFVRNLGPGLKG